MTSVQRAENYLTSHFSTVKQPDYGKDGTMAGDFEGNPFADPEGINPFAVRAAKCGE